jgi:hypothetical protein
MESSGPIILRGFLTEARRLTRGRQPPYWISEGSLRVGYETDQIEAAI